MNSTLSLNTANNAVAGAMYLYALGDCADVVPEGLTGLFDAPVTGLTIGGFQAVISPIEPVRIRPERRHLTAHQRVLHTLMAKSTVLPVAFGMILPHVARLTRTVETSHETLAEELDRVRGCVEMSVRLSLDVPSIFQYFIETDSALRMARDEMISAGLPHASKVAVGQMFERALKTRCEQEGSRVIAELEPAAVELVTDEPKTEAEILRLSALVDRSCLQDFERRVHAVAETFDSSYRFDFSGPWAPHSFVRLHLDPGHESKKA